MFRELLVVAHNFHVSTALAVFAGKSISFCLKMFTLFSCGSLLNDFCVFIFALDISHFIRYYLFSKIHSPEI